MKSFCPCTSREKIEPKVRNVSLTIVLFRGFSVSSLAWFMSNQETSFVTIGQRLLANPLK